MAYLSMRTVFAGLFFVLGGELTNRLIIEWLPADYGNFFWFGLLPSLIIGFTVVYPAAIVDNLLTGKPWGDAKGRGIFLGICFVGAQFINFHLPVDLGNEVFFSILKGFSLDTMISDTVSKVVLFVAGALGVSIFPND